MTGDHLKIIPNFSKYSADDTGNIYTTYRNGKLRKLNQHTDRYGYRTVRLTDRGHRKTKTVHRLICSAFHGICPKNMMSRHLDGDRLNNLPDNLCWGTAQDNSDDKWRHGTMCTKEKSGRARFTQSDVDLMRSRYINGETQQTIADDFKTTQNRISEIVTRKTWQ